MAGARIIEWVADLFAKALFKDTARDVLNDGTEDVLKDGTAKVAKGAIDESEKAFNPAERRIADLLASEGKDVKAG